MIPDDDPGRRWDRKAVGGLIVMIVCLLAIPAGIILADLLR